jgi:hypothetical protein
VDEIDDFSKSMSEALTFSFFVDFDGILASQTASQRTHKYVDLAKAEHIWVVSQLHAMVPLRGCSVSIKAGPIHIDHVRVLKPVHLAETRKFSTWKTVLTANSER